MNNHRYKINYNNCQQPPVNIHESPFGVSPYGIDIKFISMLPFINLLLQINYENTKILSVKLKCYGIC